MSAGLHPPSMVVTTSPPRVTVNFPVVTCLWSVEFQLRGSGHALSRGVPGKSFSRLLFVEIFAHGFEEFHDRDRFRHIGLASALPDFFLVALHGESGNGDYRNMAQIFLLLNPLCDLKAGDLRQLNIHQNEIGFVEAREFHRFDAAPGLQGLLPMRLQKIVEQLHVQLIVFHD